MSQQQEGQRKGSCGHQQQDSAEMIEGQAGANQNDPADGGERQSLSRLEFK